MAPASPGDAPNNVLITPRISVQTSSTGALRGPAQWCWAMKILRR